MTNIVKVRLRRGNSEIEIEAGRSDVDDLLSKWWLQSDQASSDEEEQSVESDLGDQKQPTKRRLRRVGATSTTKDLDPSLAPHAIANLAKEHPRVSLFEKKIFHVSGDRYNKTAFILWLIDKPLTSGQIFRALGALNIKISLPAVSNALKDNLSNFITSGQRKSGGAPSEYKLSAKARADFEKWLLADGK